jgi:hypothetical protein
MSCRPQIAIVVVTKAHDVAQQANALFGAVPLLVPGHVRSMDVVQQEVRFVSSPSNSGSCNSFLSNLT